jgi:hypothetical protein
VQLALSVAVPLIGGGIAYLSTENRSLSLVVLLALAGVFAAAIPGLEWHQERARAVEELRNSMHPIEPVESVDPYRSLGVEHSVRERRQNGDCPPYIERGQYDARLDDALRKHRVGLLIAPAGWGKSRSAYEAARRFDAKALLVRPSRPEALQAVLERHKEWLSKRHRSILWLDDLDRYLKAGTFDGAALRRLLERRQVVVLATLPRAHRAMLREVSEVPLDATVEPGDELTADERRSAAALCLRRAAAMSRSASASSSTRAASCHGGRRRDLGRDRDSGRRRPLRRRATARRALPARLRRRRAEFWKPRADWPSGDLAWFEVARLGLREPD